MKKLKVTGVLALLALALTACAPESGEVVERDYDKAWTETKQICTARSPQGACTINVPVTTTHPERCELKLKDGDDIGWVQVPCGEYTNYKVGDWYPRSK